MDVTTFAGQVVDTILLIVACSVTIGVAVLLVLLTIALYKMLRGSL